MAISPKQLEEAFQKDIDYYENYFDKHLAVNKITKGQLINVDVPSSFNLTHLAILKQRYLNAGWTDVAYNSTQRDGDWLTFKY